MQVEQIADLTRPARVRRLRIEHDRLLAHQRMIAGGDSHNEWNVVMATAILAMLPPAVVVVGMQKWFVKGLVDTEK